MERSTHIPVRFRALPGFVALVLLGVFWTGTPAAEADHEHPSSITIVTEDEPGEPMLVRGVVRDPDGKPVGGATVHVHQADTNGLYALDGGPEARIFGEMWTAADGTFEYRTIRPAWYPNSRIPQHVHTVVKAEGFRDLVFELKFSDDPYLGRPHRWDVVGTPSEPDDHGLRTVDCPIVLQRATP